MRAAILFATLASVVALAAASGGTPVTLFRCFEACKFSVCDGGRVPLFSLGTPNVAMTGPICRDGVNVGRILSTGEAYTYKDSRLVSEIGLTKVGQGFSPTFFKSYDLVVNGTKRSGIGHEVPRGNQTNYFRATCIGVPIRSYEVLGKNGNVVGCEQGTDRLTDCVPFRMLR